MVGKAVLTKNDELEKDEIIEALQDINQTGTRVLLLISNVLKWVEYQKNSFMPNYTRENLFQMVEDKIDFFRFMANSKNIDLINKIPADIYIDIDKIAFGVIIQNLLNNAVKFTPDGEVEVNVEMRDNHFSLSVTDTGNGISLENINAIKNDMTVNPQTDTDNLKGNGLGWGLIKELLHHLNGSFEMTGGERMGTKISIQLPL
jgi:signal transduction histidine kinase